MKPSERKLRAHWVPGSGARLNQYGNISGGQMTQLLSVLKLFPEVGYLANITPGSRKRNKKPRNYFLVGWENKGLRAGVWERMTSGRVKPILIFIKNPSYYARFKFYDVVRRSINKNVNRRFAEAFEAALSSKK